MLNHAAFTQNLKEAVAFHGHLCLGQIIGVRLAMLGLQLVGTHDPLGADRKKLIVFVEIGRCAADAIMTVTGSRVGRRSMKIIDYGKLAATFVNLETGVSFRIFSRDDAQKKALALYPLLSPQEAEMRAYQEMEDSDMFAYLPVRVPIKCEDMPGKPIRKVKCALCGEYVLDARDIDRYGRPLCRPCASGEAYYVIEHPECGHLPRAVGQ